MAPSMKKYFRSEVTREKGYRLESHPEAIKLNQNELPYDLSADLKEELLGRIKALPFQRYPLPQPLRLQKRLAELLKVVPEQIQFSNGSNVMIQALLVATSLKGKVMILEPTFSVYEIEAKLLGNRVIKAPLNRDFSLPTKKILAAIRKHKPKIIFLSNPNAPTGNLFPREDLLKIIKASPCLVVVDEAYVQFSRQSLISELPNFPNLVVLRTFSKGFGLGGVRVGYLVANPEVSAQVAKILLPYCVSSISEEVAHFVLDHAKHFEGIIAEVLKERDKMLAAMRAMKGIEAFETQSNFILFRSRDAQACFRHLLKRGVLTRDVSNKFHLKHCLRVSVGTPEENRIFLGALADFK